MKELFILLVIFQIKHFLADYPFQNQYMLGKSKKNGWFFPLLAHALVHGTGTLLIMLFFSPSMWFIFAVDVIIHFFVDRVKSSPNILNRFKPDNKLFWWFLGADQLIHHSTNYLMIIMILQKGISNA